MNQLLTSETKEILSPAYTRPAVSILLPFEPKMMAESRLSAELQAASERASKIIGESYSRDVVRLMNGKIEIIINGLNLSTHKKSVAIFVSPVFEKVLYLDFPVKETITVKDSFDIRDLVCNKIQTQQYLVLVLGGKISRMYVGNSSSLVNIVSNPLKSVYAFVRHMPGRVSNFSDPSERRRVVLDKMIRHIDNSLEQVLNAYHLPLFVIGAPRIVGHFKSLTRHGKAVTAYIQENAAEATEAELLQLLRPNLADWKKVKNNHLLHNLEVAASADKLVTGIKDVWAAAIGHQGRLLLVEEDFVYREKRSTAGIVYMHPGTYNPLSPVKYVVDDLIEMVFEYGGDVEFVDNGTLREYGGIALIKYY